MGWYLDILKMAIPEWEGKEMGLYQRCSDVWTNFTYLAALIKNGCEPNKAAWEVHVVGWMHRVQMFFPPLSWLALTSLSALPTYMSLPPP